MIDLPLEQGEQGDNSFDTKHGQSSLPVENFAALQNKSLSKGIVLFLQYSPNA